MALAACKGDKTLAKLAEQFGVHPAQITEWKRHLLERVADVFGGTTHKVEAPDLKVLYATIRQLGPPLCQWVLVCQRHGEGLLGQLYG